MSTSSYTYVPYYTHILMYVHMYVYNMYVSYLMYLCTSIFLTACTLSHTYIHTGVCYCVWILVIVSVYSCTCRENGGGRYGCRRSAISVLSEQVREISWLAHHKVCQSSPVIIWGDTGSQKGAFVYLKQCTKEPLVTGYY